MVLTVDIGNTHTVLGGFEGEEIRFVARISTDSRQTEDEYASRLLNVLRVRGIEPGAISGVILSSVVPPLNAVFKQAIRYVFSARTLVVGPGMKTGLGIHCDAPSSVGADIICACAGAQHYYGSPALIADLGTATKMMVLQDGAFVGVSIIPGVMTGLEALCEHTAQLPRISLDAPRHAVEKNTADCMRSGVIFGHASMLDGMIARIREEVGEELPVYATGGLAGLIVPHCRERLVLDEHLVLKGLNVLYRKNTAE